MRKNQEEMNFHQENYRSDPILQEQLTSAFQQAMNEDCSFWDS